MALKKTRIPEAALHKSPSQRRCCMRRLAPRQRPIGPALTYCSAVGYSGISDTSQAEARVGERPDLSAIPTSTDSQSKGGGKAGGGGQGGNGLPALDAAFAQHTHKTRNAVVDHILQRDRTNDTPWRRRVQSHRQQPSSLRVLVSTN